MSVLGVWSMKGGQVAWCRPGKCVARYAGLGRAGVIVPFSIFALILANSAPAVPRRLRPEQTGCFPMLDVEQVGQGIVGADRVDEVPWQASGDQDRRHRRVSRQVAGWPGLAVDIRGCWRTVPLWGHRWDRARE